MADGPLGNATRGADYFKVEGSNRGRERVSLVTICTLKGVFEVLVPVLSLGAAGWWFAASWIVRGSFLETVIVDFDRKQRLQARYNAIAASCAGLAAILQIAVTYMPVCRAFG